MKLYCGIDLHSNNNVPVVIDENDKILFQKRLPNNLDTVVRALEPFKDNLVCTAVESTFNWYWLVDGLDDAGFDTCLVNPAAVKQYEGLKRTDDEYDAYWLAHLMRLDILPTGYIYPKEDRSLRDLLRRRTQLVKHCTTHVLSIQNQIWRNTGERLQSEFIKKLDGSVKVFDDPNLQLSIECNWKAMTHLTHQIRKIERSVLQQAKLRPEYERLLSVDGIGKILAFTIMLETGDIGRFKSVGNYASYCRCVDSLKTSNGKKKGTGNRKNGNKHLSWAFVEAANFCRRYNEKARRFHQRKLAKTNKFVAIKALAHKLSRACYFILRDQVDFDENKLFT
jgi:transposase